MQGTVVWGTCRVDERREDERDRFGLVLSSFLLFHRLELRSLLRCQDSESVAAAVKRVDEGGGRRDDEGAAQVLREAFEEGDRG
ncbi:hypothetical protein HA466_0058830 [Hirschfeldia incana]|nr:hypothetical protein HA466_0058830 [Hirschfeldia incana]